MAGKNLLVSMVIRARDEASSVFGKMGTKVAAVGAAIAAVFSIRALNNFFRGAVGLAATFEEQMDVVAAVTRASAEELALLEKAAAEMGATTRYTATEAAKALENLARAGLSAQESVTALPGVLTLAQGNAIGLESAASLVTRAIRGMGLEVNEAARVADVFTAAAASANTTVEDLGVGLSYVAPVAAGAGLSLEQTTAILGKLADAGIEASRGGTSLTNVLAQLRDPASLFRRELAALGITSTNFIEVLAGLEAAGPRAAAALNAIGLRAGPAMEALIGQGSAAVEGLTERLLGAAGAAQEAADIMDENLPGALRGLGSIWEAVQNRLAKPLLEPIADHVRALTARIREAVDSGLIDRLGVLVQESFTKASTAVVDFLAKLDIEAAAKVTVGWIETIATSISGLARTLNGVAGAISFVWNAVYQSVALVGAAIAKVVQGIVWSAAQGASALNKIGLVSQETVNELMIMQRGFGASADAMAEAAVDSYERMQSAGGQVIEALTGIDVANRTVAQSAEETAAAVDAFGGAVDDTRRRMEEAIEGTRNYAAVVDQLQHAYDETLAAFRAGNATWEEVVEAMHAVDAARRELTENTATDAGQVAAAFKLLGVESTETLTNLAREARTAYEVIAAGQTTIEDQNRAWLAWAKTALASGDSVQVSLAETEASVRGLSDEYSALRQETLGIAGANDVVVDSMQRLVDGYAEAERAATRESVALAESVRQREKAAQVALDAAKAAGDENRIRQASIDLAQAEVASAEATAAAKAAESFAAWEHVRALYAEAAADGVLTAAEARVIQAAREVAGAKEQQARAHANAADAKRQEAQATQESSMQAVGWAELVAQVRKQYAGLSDEAALYFDKMFGTVRTLREFFEILGSRIFNEVKREFEEMTARAGHLTEQLGRAELTTKDLAYAQRFLNEQARAVAQTNVALGAEQLEPLRRALADAERRMRSLQEGARDTLSSLQDELLGLQGQEDALAERQRERRRADIEAQLAEARAAKNEEAVRDLQAALEVLDRIGKEEQRQRDARAREDQRRERDQKQQTSGAAAPAPARTVRMDINVGGEAGTVNVLDGDDATLERLLRSLESGKGRMQ